MLSNNGVLAATKAFRVLVIGGSYGGLAAALTLVDLSRGRVPRFSSDPDASLPPHRVPIQITVADERDGYYHLIGSPKALACEKFASESWTRFQDIPALKSPNIKFIQGSVSSIDCAAKVAQILETETQSTRAEPYDYLVVGSGLRRAFPTVPRSIQRAKFLQEAKRHAGDIRNAREGVVIIGGGAVGVEMAAELKALVPEQKVTLIHSRKRLLSSEPLPDDFAERVETILHEMGVEVILEQRVVDTIAVDADGERCAWRLTLSGGQQLTTGHVLSAVSRPIPTSTYLSPEALTDDGYVKVHSSLQFSGSVPNSEHHFAVGDVAAWNGIKRCGGAMHMGHYAGNNIYQHILAECGFGKPSYMTLSPFANMIGLALGHKAVSWTPDEGTRHGADVLTSLFGEDMANT
ncbi:FAD-dependent pyridine nucleotide-disulfide oxidoreductase, partial [Penicillium sp. IBT 18751x]